jgi:glycosyltransferase involved in cell wall biosynthesis
VRIAYYTHPAFFEPALCLVRELSRQADVDLLLEISDSAWQSAAFDAARRPLTPGIVDGDAALADAFPAGVRDYWRSAASFHLVAHSSRRSLDPRAWRLSRKVLRFANARGADVLHIDDVDVSPRLAIGLPGAQHPPIALAVHDPEPHEGERNWRKSLARRLAYPRARRFVMYNRAFRQAFAARYGVRREVIDVARLGRYDVCREWSATAGRDSGLVLFFGRVSPYKGLETLYASLPIVASRVGNVRCVVAGRPIDGYTPPAPPNLDQVRVEVIDRYLSNDEAARLFQTAAVVVCPYRDATQSGVVLTAFAFGVPVVATAVGGMAEYVFPDETGLLVPAGDPQALADAVSRLLLDEPLRARLQQGIERAAAGELSWRGTADALLRTYAECRLHPPTPC